MHHFEIARVNLFTDFPTQKNVYQLALIVYNLYIISMNEDRDVATPSRKEKIIIYDVLCVYIKSLT
jgi:hypothetical protein